ncbi:MAG: hypothetical protein AMXMBFR58_13360 [Phycisphaerae bacterium]|nr:hypothetical protein [Phycisphaerales bacterium]
MRLPVASLHRAFPELDPFSDAECAAFIRAAQRGRPGFVALGALVATIAFIAAPSCLLTLFLAVVKPLFVIMRWQAPGGMWFPVMAILLVVGSGAVSALLVRDSFLRALIRRQVGSARCTECGYQLLGLPIEKTSDDDGTVRCPECGARTLLSSRGLSPAQLAPLCGS